MAELADAADLKSAGEILVGSSPTPGTSYRHPGNQPEGDSGQRHFVHSPPSGRLMAGSSGRAGDL
ncbi:MAG: hypothetical protein HW402_807 [Dehalococcoidales bacterium]|nr:hypothetical protein [Dehalococcoidales bacterium]